MTSHGPSMRLANSVSLLALEPRPLTLSESRAKEGRCRALMPAPAGEAPAEEMAESGSWAGGQGGARECLLGCLAGGEDAARGRTPQVAG